MHDKNFKQQIILKLLGNPEFIKGCVDISDRTNEYIGDTIVFHSRLVADSLEEERK